MVASFVDQDGYLIETEVGERIQLDAEGYLDALDPPAELGGTWPI
ncbi:MAG TPA: hypothetical protein VFC99_09265 [Acidimicrobiia bacterium]|nr:hypothetical protein [Acidimicrobiia bacterium]